MWGAVIALRWSSYLLVDFLAAVDLRAVDFFRAVDFLREADFLRAVDFLREADFLFALLLDDVLLPVGLVLLLDDELPELLPLPSRELFDEPRLNRL
jgi:hypothetical protein